MPQETVKRKRPPTFQHYPENRAKILKKTWVENAKIKSKWKAEKRKQGLVEESKLDIPEYDEKEEGASGSASETGPPPKEHLLHPSRAHIHPDLAPKVNPVKERPQTDKKEGAEPTPQSLRDLTREAYSQSSLHTYKSDPLHRRRGDRGTAPSRRPSRGGERGGMRGQGRGQPNMKLRMNAMLAKIKQDIEPRS